MSANLLAEGDRRDGLEGTTYADGVWSIPANGTSKDKNAVNDWTTGTEAVSGNQTLHVGLSVRAASGASVVVAPGVAYVDGAGNVNYVATRVSARGTGAWQRVEGSFVMPSGMRVSFFFVHQGAGGAAVELSSPTLSYGSPVTLASDAHTPYATQDHVAAEYATKAALKVTSDAVTAEVTERGKLAGRVGTLESTSGTHTSKLEQLATSIKSLVKGESTYTDPDGKSATSGIYSLVTQTRDSVTALFGQYTKTADLASTQAVKDAKKAASAAQTTANSAKSTASTAKSTADSLATMIREDATGITVGKSANGKTWSTGRTRQTANAFEVLSKAGEVLSSFGENVIELGKNSQDAVISMLGGLVTIKATSAGISDGAWCEMSTDELISVEGYHASKLAAGYKDETGFTPEGTAVVMVNGGEGDGGVMMYAGARDSDGNSFAMFPNGYFLNHPEYLLKELWQPSVTYTGSNDTYTANAEDWIISHMDNTVGGSRADDYFTFSQGVITALRDCLLEISGVAYWTSGPVGQYGFGFFVGSSTVKSGTEKSVFSYKASAGGQFSVTMPPINIGVRKGTKIAVGRYSMKGSVYRNGYNFSWVTIKVIEDRSG